MVPSLSIISSGSVVACTLADVPRISSTLAPNRASQIETSTTSPGPRRCGLSGGAAQRFREQALRALRQQLTRHLVVDINNLDYRYTRFRS